MSSLNDILAQAGQLAAENEDKHRQTIDELKKEHEAEVHALQVKIVFVF